MVRSSIVRVAGSAILLAVAACAESSRPPDPVAVVGVNVLPNTVQLFGVGDTATITATIVPTNATDRVVLWESSDPTIVEVSTAGHVTAKSVGFGVFITAYTHDGQFQASTNVSVNP